MYVDQHSLHSVYWVHLEDPWHFIYQALVCPVETLTLGVRHTQMQKCS